jgi:quercetin dioxygenase-like cupin family protein
VIHLASVQANSRKLLPPLFRRTLDKKGKSRDEYTQERRQVMSSKPFILRPADRKPPLAVIGTQIVVLASGADIEDQQITVQSGGEGTGPPPHSHDWDESFYVTKGQVVFTCAGETAMCPAGTLVHVPAGTVHAFSFGPSGGEMLEMTGKRSNAIPTFTALDREIPPGPLDVAKVVQVLVENGVKVHI